MDIAGGVSPFALQALIKARWRNRGASAKGYWAIALAHFVMNGSALWLAAVSRRSAMCALAQS
jgi:hypothetical protein